MIYSVHLNREELAGYVFCATRGYCGDDSLLNISTAESNDGATIGFERESDAWEWAESVDSDPHAFGTCAGASLLAKLNQLRDSIV